MDQFLCELPHVRKEEKDKRHIMFFDPRPRALLPVLIALHPVWERGVEGVDLNDSAFGGIAGCLDPGLEAGGLGHVNFKLYAEEVG